MKTALIDPKFFNLVAQFAHFGMMFFVTVVIGILFLRFDHEFVGILVGFLVCSVYAAVHEFWWDPTHEDPETRGSDLQDFVFLVLGSCAGVVILLLIP